MLSAALNPYLGEVRPAGLVISSAAGRFPGDVEEERVATPSGVALRVAIAPSRARETIILPLVSHVADGVTVWTQLAEGERDWFVWALDLLDLPALSEWL